MAIPPEHQSFNTSKYSLTVASYTSFQISPHFHKNYEFALVLEGSADFSMNGQSYPLRKNDCILVNCYQIHGFTVPADGRLWVISFSPNCVKSFHTFLSGHKAATSVFRLPDSVMGLLADKMIDPDRSDCEHYTALPPDREPTIKACLYAICGEYIQNTTMEKTGKEAETLAFDVIRYIAENFKENITLESAAKELRYNYHYLSKVFNQNVGYNFKSMLNQYRVEYAVQLLEESELPITQVAFESGFQSQRTFNRIFEELYKTSPTQYRKDHKKA